VLHHHLEQRLLDRLDHHVVHAVRLGAAQVRKYCSRLSRTQSSMVLLAHAAHSSQACRGSASADRRGQPVHALAPGVEESATPALRRQSSMAVHAAAEGLAAGQARTAQPMCLRALRTPVSSPYRL
jgi:hypothetical protein